MAQTYSITKKITISAAGGTDEVTINNLGFEFEVFNMHVSIAQNSGILVLDSTAKDMMTIGVKIAGSNETLVSQMPIETFNKLYNNNDRFTSFIIAGNNSLSVSLVHTNAAQLTAPYDIYVTIQGNKLNK